MDLVKQHLNQDDKIFTINLPTDAEIEEQETLNYWVWADYVPPGQ